MIYAAGFILVALGVLLYLMRRDVAKKAQAEARLDEKESVIEDLHQARIVRDKLRDDPDFAQRLRDKYQRD